jgi:hypothetical protein
LRLQLLPPLLLLLFLAHGMRPHDMLAETKRTSDGSGCAAAFARVYHPGLVGIRQV